MKEDGAGRRRGSGADERTGGGARERVLGGGEGVRGISEQVAGRGSRGWERDELLREGDTSETFPIYVPRVNPQDPPRTRLLCACCACRACSQSQVRSNAA